MVGRRNSQPQNNIEIGGMGIRPLHATIIKKEDSYWLVPEGVPEEFDSNIYLNGDQLSSGTRLWHLDRVSFGTNNMFVMMVPGGEVREGSEEKQQIDWDFAQNELYLKKNEIEKQVMEERERKLRE